MIDKAKCFTETMRQLALEYNAKPENFTANQVTVTTPAKPDGVRLYSHELPFFQMASTGSGVVITANEVLHPFLKEFTGDTERFKHPYWLFELPHLLCIERELNKYDYTLSSTFHMFLPGKPRKTRIMPCAFTLKWFDKTSVKTLYPNTDFPNALSEKKTPTARMFLRLRRMTATRSRRWRVLRQTRTHCGRSASTYKNGTADMDSAQHL